MRRETKSECSGTNLRLRVTGLTRERERERERETETERQREREREIKCSAFLHKKTTFCEDFFLMFLCILKSERREN